MRINLDGTDQKAPAIPVLETASALEDDPNAQQKASPHKKAG